MASRACQGIKVVWTERAWERLTVIEAFVARDHPEEAVGLVDKLIARGDVLSRNPDRSRKLPAMPGSGLRELVIESFRIEYRRMLNTIDVLTVFEEHRLLSATSSLMTCDGQEAMCPPGCP